MYFKKIDCYLENVCWWAKKEETKWATTFVILKVLNESGFDYSDGTGGS